MDLEDEEKRRWIIISVILTIVTVIVASAAWYVLTMTAPHSGDGHWPGFEAPEKVSSIEWKIRVSDPYHPFYDLSKYALLLKNGTTIG